jgi:hypothetical protein
LPAFIIFLSLFLKRKSILGNNPELGYDTYEEGSSQIFMLDDMQFGEVWMLSWLKRN